MDLYAASGGGVDVSSKRLRRVRKLALGVDDLLVPLGHSARRGIVSEIHLGILLVRVLSPPFFSLGAPRAHSTFVLVKQVNCYSKARLTWSWSMLWALSCALPGCGLCVPYLPYLVVALLALLL